MQEYSFGRKLYLVLVWGLCAVFLILKLAQVGLPADWSWWWVFSPLWITFGIGFGAQLLGLLLGYLSYKFASPEEKNIRKAREALRDYSNLK